MFDVQGMLGSQHEEVFRELAESSIRDKYQAIMSFIDFKVFQEMWKNDYAIITNFETGFLKIRVVQEHISKSRLK